MSHLPGIMLTFLHTYGIITDYYARYTMSKKAQRIGLNHLGELAQLANKDTQP